MNDRKGSKILMKGTLNELSLSHSFTDTASIPEVMQGLNNLVRSGKGGWW